MKHSISELLTALPVVYVGMVVIGGLIILAARKPVLGAASLGIIAFAAVAYAMGVF